MRRFTLLTLTAMMIGCTQPSSALAETAKTVIDDVKKATKQQIDAFKADPSSILKVNPIGGLQLSALIKALVLADPTLVDTIMSMTASANKQQASAIGAGIGQAVAEVTALADSPDNAGLKDSFKQVAKTIAGLNPTSPQNLALLAGYTTGSGSTTTTSTTVPGGPVGGSPSVTSTAPAGTSSSPASRNTQSSTPNSTQTSGQTISSGISSPSSSVSNF